MNKSPSTSLRFGWTTGACATAAARAAAIGMATGQIPQSVQITLPRGQTPEFAIQDGRLGPDWAEATVIKDAGDDPDVTHLARITTRLSARARGLRFIAGAGVGTVTRPGLPIGPGEPAINPVPRAMIRETLHEIAAQYALPAGFDITISVPGGQELARQTWNPRLGIEGGISILGTTGIVRPFSCSAWIASIHRGVDVARASGLDHVVGATGATSETAARTRYPHLPEMAFLDMGDFVGGLIKYLRRFPVPRLSLFGGPGKFAKLSQGAMDLHSGRSQVDFPALARRMGAAGDPIAGANTVLEALHLVGPALARTIAADAAAVVNTVLQGAGIAVEIVIIDRAGAVLAVHPFAR